MLSVIIPTEGVERTAVATLAALVPGAAAGVVKEVLLVDRAGTGVIERVADVAGCRFLSFEGTRAAALAAGARQARSPWLMFLHAGAVLDAGWIEETTQFIQLVASSGRPKAGNFSLRPLALRRYQRARRLQIRGANDRGPVRRTGPSYRTRALRPARRLPARRPTLRGEAVAPARPLLPGHAAQPDHGGLTRTPEILAKVK